VELYDLLCTTFRQLKKGCFVKKRFQSNYPAHGKLEAELRADIVEGRISPGTKICSETGLADRYGISRGSVRTALDNLTRGGLLRKVRGSGTFVEKRTPGCERQIVFLSFATALSREVFFDAGTYLPVINGMTALCAENNCNLIVSHVGADWKVPQKLASGEIAGVVFHGQVNREFYRRWIAPHPNVGIQYPHPEYTGNCVRYDEKAFSYRAVEYLKELGHERIGFVSNEIDMPISLERYYGFRMALKEFGLPFSKNNCAVWQRPDVNGELPNEYVMPDYREQLEPLFAHAQPPTALVCVDDWRAYCALTALDKMKRSVSVIGGRNGKASRYPVQITGFDFRLEEICSKAVWLLLEVLKGDLAGGVNLQIQPELLPGETTSTPNQRI
jgi:DNA-binding LacI/PurR family transcriptional regulator/DNA-binding transcriptional regulator YhcF (GntR family)